MVKLLLFAAAREAAGGAAELEVEVGEGSTVRDVVDAAVRARPGLAALVPSMVVAVNLEYVAVDSRRAVRDTDEIALIPPMSGG